MKRVDGITTRQDISLKQLLLNLRMNPHRMKQIMESGALAALLHPGADFTRLTELRQTLRLGDGEGDCVIKPTQHNLDEMFEYLEGRRNVVTDRVKELFHHSKVELGGVADKYRYWIVRMSTFPGGNFAQNVHQMGWQLPHPEVALWLRRQRQEWLGPDEIIVPTDPILRDGKGTRAWPVLRKSEKGTGDILDILELHQGFSFRPDHYVAVVNPYGSYESLCRVCPEEVE